MRSQLAISIPAQARLPVAFRTCAGRATRRPDAVRGVASAHQDVDDSSILIVAHMEVRRIIVGLIHRNDDSAEVANLWHNTLF